jgi:hypothetical protein
MRIHPLNTRTLWWACVIVLALTFVALVAVSAQACQGFEPSSATLACISHHEGSPAYTHDGRWYDGHYELSRAFALTYSANIGPEQWAHWGSVRSAPTWTWHPMIQDEVARNGVRARGLQPWPPSRGRC